MTNTVCNSVTHTVSHDVTNDVCTSVQNQNQNQIVLKASCGVCGSDQIQVTVSTARRLGFGAKE